MRVRNLWLLLKRRSDPFWSGGRQSRRRHSRRTTRTHRRRGSNSTGTHTVTQWEGTIIPPRRICTPNSTPLPLSLGTRVAYRRPHLFILRTQTRSVRDPPLTSSTRPSTHQSFIRFRVPVNCGSLSLTSLMTFLLFGCRSSLARLLNELVCVDDDGVAYSLFGYARYDALIHPITKYPFQNNQAIDQSTHARFLYSPCVLHASSKTSAFQPLNPPYFAHSHLRSLSVVPAPLGKAILHPTHTYKTCFCDPPLASILVQITLFTSYICVSPILSSFSFCRATPFTLSLRVYLYASSSDPSGFGPCLSRPGDGSHNSLPFIDIVFSALRSVLLSFFLKK